MPLDPYTKDVLNKGPWPRLRGRHAGSTQGASVAERAFAHALGVFARVPGRWQLLSPCPCILYCVVTVWSLNKASGTDRVSDPGSMFYNADLCLVSHWILVQAVTGEAAELEWLGQQQTAPNHGGDRRSFSSPPS
jgi:hypothetical protein